MNESVRALEKMAERAERLLDAGQLRRSERVLQDMLSLDPNNRSAHFNLARVYRRTEQFDLALKHARRTLRLNPAERNAHLNLGLIYDIAGRHKLATFHYKRELTHNPDSAETCWNLGRLYFRRHRWRDASKYLRRCFDLRFMWEIEDTVDKLGICYNKLGEVEPYILIFNEYVRMFPKASWAFLNLGRALMAAKNYKAAVLRLTRAHQLQRNEKTAKELTRAREMLLRTGRGK